MADKQLQIDARNTIIVSEVADASGGINRWAIRPDQAEKQLVTFEEHDRKLAPGDVSAIRDVVADVARQKSQDEKNL